MGLQAATGLTKKQSCSTDETIFRAREDARKQARASLTPDQQWGSIMWAIFNFLYRQYCREHLIMMRKCGLRYGAMS